MLILKKPHERACCAYYDLFLLDTCLHEEIERVVDQAG